MIPRPARGARGDELATACALAVAANPLLRDELVLRGGVALHHFVLPAPLRRCLGLEYARRTTTPIGPVLDALRALARAHELRIRTEVRDRPRVYLTDANRPGSHSVRVRLDLETRETQPRLPLVRRTVLTCATDELLGLILRELYRRSRSRDLFDLWAGLTHLAVDDAVVVDVFRDACARTPLGRVGRGAFVARLHRHLARPAYPADLEGLPVDATGYSPQGAASMITDQLLARLPR